MLFSYSRFFVSLDYRKCQPHASDNLLHKLSSLHMQYTAFKPMYIYTSYFFFPQQYTNSALSLIHAHYRVTK